MKKKWKGGGRKVKRNKREVEERWKRDGIEVDTKRKKDISEVEGSGK